MDYALWAPLRVFKFAPSEYVHSLRLPRSGRAKGYVSDEICRACGGAVRIIASIEDPVVIEKIPSLGPLTVHPCTTPLAHLDKQDAPTELSRLPETRAPPQAGLFD